MQLQSGTLLQGGKYKIERVLGQGGFGITYLAKQELFDRHVCIKEFFFKDYCERGAQGEVTSYTTNSKELVDRFLNKFIKEARTISRLDHPNIVRILDIFQENGTAYYAMEYIEGCSLADKVNEQGALSEAAAVDYIKQVASALDYIHQRSINHLDVKPANIMVRQSDNKAILIDFGLSKQYDELGGQTSTTPVGISHGYAPMEQYNQGGVSIFSPQTDVYSLGATLYKLVTSNTPPEAIEIFNEGLTGLPQSLSPNLVAAIKKTMQPKKGDRPRSIGEFTALLGGQFAAKPNPSISQCNSDESTRIIGTSNGKPAKNISSPQPAITKVEGEKQSSAKKWLCLPVVFVIAILAIVFWPKKTCVEIVECDSLDAEVVEPDSVDLEYVYAEPAFASKKTYTVNGVSFTMVRVAGGTFTMGASSGDSDANSDEKPAHQVTLSSYSIGETEVTQALWQAVMGSNPSLFTGNLQRPVERVSWNECQAFIRKLNSLTGATFRLPTEAEWEYAARGGSQSCGYKYGGGNSLGDVAWYTDNSSNTTHMVKTKQPNELGLYDMSGNVLEWCADWYSNSYYASSPKNNPQGPSSGSARVLRGGSWFHTARICRVAIRGNFAPDRIRSVIGFRLAQ